MLVETTFYSLINLQYFPNMRECAFTHFSYWSTFCWGFSDSPNRVETTIPNVPLSSLEVPDTPFPPLLPHRSLSPLGGRGEMGGFMPFTNRSIDMFGLPSSLSSWSEVPPQLMSGCREEVIQATVPKLQGIFSLVSLFSPFLFVICTFFYLIAFSGHGSLGYHPGSWLNQLREGESVNACFHWGCAQCHFGCACWEWGDSWELVLGQVVFPLFRESGYLSSWAGG